MNPKITIFIPSLQGGGAERAMLNTALGMAKRGYKVDLVLCKARGEYLDQVEGSINLIDLNKSRVLFCIFPLIKYLHEAKTHCILSAMNYVNIITILSVWLSRVKVRVVISERTTLSKVGAFNKRYKKQIINWLVRSTYKHADKIVCVSKGVAEDLKSNYNIRAEKLTVIYNPTINRKMLDKSYEEVDCPWYKKDVSFILSVGRLIEDKDFGTLIRAYNEMSDGDKYMLIILGEGEKRVELEKMINDLGLEERVILPGFVKNPYFFMRKASVFVLSSKREGLPNVLIEAMACGTQVISTDCESGPSEILQNGRYGRLVPVGDYKKLSEAISETLNSKYEIQPSALVKFTEDTVLDEYIETLVGRLDNFKNYRL